MIFGSTQCLAHNVRNRFKVQLHFFHICFGKTHYFWVKERRNCMIEHTQICSFCHYWLLTCIAPNATFEAADQIVLPFHLISELMFGKCNSCLSLSLYPCLCQTAQETLGAQGSPCPRTVIYSGSGTWRDVVHLQQGLLCSLHPGKPPPPPLALSGAWPSPEDTGSSEPSQRNLLCSHISYNLNPENR